MFGSLMLSVSNCVSFSCSEISLRDCTSIMSAGASCLSSSLSIADSLCTRSSLVSISYNSHIFLKFSKSGKQILFSHFDIDCLEIRSFFETSSCDMFFFFLAAFNLSPILSALISASNMFSPSFFGLNCIAALFFKERDSSPRSFCYRS